jgi:hypothetical protein
MKGWTRLKNINPVSGKLWEAQIDPNGTTTKGRFRATEIWHVGESKRLTQPEWFSMELV